MDDDLKDVYLEEDEPAIKQKHEVDEIIRKLELIANADIRNLFDDDGAILSPKKWPDEIAMAVIRITPGAHGLIIQLADKGKALENLARIKGAYKPTDVARSPLEEMFENIPREDKKTILKHLKMLARLEKKADRQKALDEANTSTD